MQVLRLRNVCVDWWQHINYDIDVGVLQRSLLLTSVGVAKAALEYFLHDDDEEADAIEADGPEGCHRFVVYVRRVLSIGIVDGVPHAPPSAAPYSYDVLDDDDDDDDDDDGYRDAADRSPQLMSRLRKASAAAHAPHQYVRRPSRGAYVDAVTAEALVMNAAGTLGA